MSQIMTGTLCFVSFHTKHDVATGHDLWHWKAVNCPTYLCSLTDKSFTANNIVGITEFKFSIGTAHRDPYKKVLPPQQETNNRSWRWLQFCSGERFWRPRALWVSLILWSIRGGNKQHQRETKNTVLLPTYSCNTLCFCSQRHFLQPTTSQSSQRPSKLVAFTGSASCVMYVCMYVCIHECMHVASIPLMYALYQTSICEYGVCIVRMSCVCLVSWLGCMSSCRHDVVHRLIHHCGLDI